jgi:hypothetical protein
MPSRYLDELAPLLPGGFVTEWMVLGPFEAPVAGEVPRPDLGDTPWTPATGAASGHLDLIRAVEGPHEHVIAYAGTWMHVSEPRTVGVTLGTDDGSRVWLNYELVYENAEPRSASPLEHVARWELDAGWNRVLFEVRNGTGEWGLYFRVLDDAVTCSAEGPASR